jgi:hypothetical protein
MQCLSGDPSFVQEMRFPKVNLITDQNLYNEDIAECFPGDCVHHRSSGL